MFLGSVEYFVCSTASTGTLLIMSLFLSCCWLCADEGDVYMEPPTFLLKTWLSPLFQAVSLEKPIMQLGFPAVIHLLPYLMQIKDSRLPCFSWQPALKEMPLRGWKVRDGFQGSSNSLLPTNTQKHTLWKTGAKHNSESLCHFPCMT